MKVAKEWGLTPAEYRKEEVDNKARMMAAYLAEKIIDSYNFESGKVHSKHKAEQNKKNTGNKKRSLNPRLIDPRMQSTRRG